MAIALGSVLSVALMAAHPTVHARGVSDLVEGVVRQAAVNGLVHGALIALLGVLFFGFSGLSSRLGLGRAAVRGGLVAYAFGAAALTAAALVNGFVVPELAARYRTGPAADLEALWPVLGLCHAANQVCSRLGTLAIAVAVLLWSLPLARRRGLQRAIGAFGLTAGVLFPAALLAGRLPMTVHGLGAFLLVQAAWGVAVAVELLRGRL